jgi:hypothetical protein
LACLLVGAGVIYVGVALAFGREREYSPHDTTSPRIEGRWKLAFLGKNSDGVACERDLSELEIHFDEWFDTTLSISDSRWGGHSYWVQARGRVRVGDREAPMCFGVATDRESYWGPYLLLDASESRGPVLIDDDGPLAGCGWGDRMTVFLRVDPGTVGRKSGWESDRLLVAFGSDERGALRPHEYARASR